MNPALPLVFAHVPVYVWALLVALLLLGQMQSRDRWVSRTRLAALPLIWLGYGFWSVASNLGQSEGVILAWALGLLVSLLGLTRQAAPSGSRFNAQTQQYFVPGSWLPLALMMAVFAAKFALSMSLSLKPEWTQQAEIAWGFSAGFGALGGVLLARAWRVLRLATGPVPALQGA